jgi:hypothetical protein
MRERRVVLGALVVAAILVGVIVIAPSLHSSTTTPSTTELVTSSTSSGSTSTPVGQWPFEFSSGVSSSGLQLKVLLNSTSMRQDGAIRAQVEAVNTLNRNVTVSNLVQNDNATRWSSYIDVCPWEYFLGYAVFEGHLTASNISAAANSLRLAPLITILCPGGVGFVALRFLPNGSEAMASIDSKQPGHFFWNASAVVNATTRGVCDNNTVSGDGGFSCSYATPGLVGYWNYSAPIGENNSAFHRFSPGEYTMVAWDDWNQYVYATFNVESQENSSSAALEASSCIVPVPAGGTLDPYFHNSTFAGDEVTLTNGTEKFYSYFSCPRPVSLGLNTTSGVPNLYAMGVAAVTNSTFIAAENGSQFILLHPSLLTCCDQNAEPYVQFYFFHYGGRSNLDTCGWALDNQTSSPFYVRIPDAGIIVTFHAVGNPYPAWAFHDPTIQVMSSCQQLIGNFGTGVAATA